MRGIELGVITKWLRCRTEESPIKTVTCSDCDHESTDALPGNWGWLPAINGLLPIQYACEDKDSQGATCGCRRPMHLRY